jgi:hypothetical protein
LARSVAEDAHATMPMVPLVLTAVRSIPYLQEVCLVRSRSKENVIFMIGNVRFFYLPAELDSFFTSSHS